MGTSAAPAGRHFPLLYKHPQDSNVNANELSIGAHAFEICVIGRKRKISVDGH